MTNAIDAAAVLADQAQQPRRPKPTDHRLRLRFSVLPDEEALRRLPRFDAGPELSDDPPEDEHCYAPYSSEGGVGIYGELKALGGRTLRSGDFVQMEIRGKGRLSRVRCLGEVRWVRVSHDAGIFRAGVVFVGVDPRDLH